MAVESNTVVPEKLCHYQVPPSGANEDELKKALAYLKNVCLPMVKRVHECTYRTDAILSEFNDYKNKFFDDPSNKQLFVSSYNSDIPPQDRNYDVYRNFEIIKQKQHKAISIVQSFINEYASTDRVGLDIHQAIKDLDTAYRTMSSELLELSMAESAFLLVLNNTLANFRQSYEWQKDDIQWIFSKSCVTASLATVLTNVNQVSQSMTSQMEKLKKYIVAVRNSRFNLVQFAYKSLRQKLSNKITEYYVNELSETREKIQIILRVNDIANMYELWWLNTFNDWERNNLYQVYLQYEKPLALYRMDVLQAHSYKKQIELATVDYPEVGEAFLNHLVNNIIPVAERRVSRLESKSWQGVLQRQKLLAQRRIDDSRYNNTCKLYMNNYLEQANKITDFEDYRAIEVIYKEGVDKCRS